MRIMFPVMIAALIAAGCKPPKLPPSKPTERAGGVVSQIIDKVKETVTMVEMKDLHLFIANEETLNMRMPTEQEVRDYAKKSNKKLSELLENGTIVLWLKNRGGLWAYEKDAPQKGGWIITDLGPQKITVEEAKSWLANVK